MLRLILGMVSLNMKLLLGWDIKMITDRILASEVVKIARSLLASPLDGMNKPRAVKLVNNILHRHTSGLFRDEDWSHVNKLFDVLRNEGIDYELTDAKYTQNEKGVPTAKTWRFTIEFTNDRGRPTILYGIITAAGAGSVEYPLDRYDLVAYVS